MRIRDKKTLEERIQEKKQDIIDSFKYMNRCDEEKMQCRYCKFAQKEHIGWSHCVQYPVDKPDDVYFENAPCPKFEQGIDLLPFELTMT